MSTPVTACVLSCSAFCFADHPVLDQRHGACLQCGDTPLRAAAKFDQKELVQLLLSHGACASAENNVSKQVVRAHQHLLIFMLAHCRVAKPLLIVQAIKA